MFNENTGKKALYKTESMRFAVRVLKVREVYGRTDYLIVPTNGSGEKWVSSSALEFTEENNKQNVQARMREIRENIINCRYETGEQNAQALAEYDRLLNENYNLKG